MNLGLDDLGYKIGIAVRPTAGFVEDEIRKHVSVAWTMVRGHQALTSLHEDNDRR